MQDSETQDLLADQVLDPHRATHTSRCYTFQFMLANRTTQHISLVAALLYCNMTPITVNYSSRKIHFHSPYIVHLSQSTEKG